MAGKIKRSKLAIFLDTAAAGSQEPTWSLIGDGVTDVESYRLNIATPMTAIAGDPRV